MLLLGICRSLSAGGTRRLHGDVGAAGCFLHMTLARKRARRGSRPRGELKWQRSCWGSDSELVRDARRQARMGRERCWNSGGGACGYCQRPVGVGDAWKGRRRWVGGGNCLESREGEIPSVFFCKFFSPSVVVDVGGGEAQDWLLMISMLLGERYGGI